jgi:hypothetical protein
MGLFNKKRKNEGESQALEYGDPESGSDIESEPKYFNDSIPISTHRRTKIRDRDHGCLLCLSTKGLNVAHIIARTPKNDYQVNEFHTCIIAVSTEFLCKANWIRQTGISKELLKTNEENLMYCKFTLAHDHQPTK